MLFTFMFVLVDTGLQYLNIYINKWYIAQKEKAVKDQAKKDKTSKSVIRRKVSIYEGTIRHILPAPLFRAISALSNQLFVYLLYRSWLCILTRER